MNIFVLSQDPYEAAKAQIDKHVVKMPLETAQLLCSAFPQGTAPYRQTHLNHPCSIWARQTAGNFLWLCEHGEALGQEYWRRYGKDHKSVAVIRWARENMNSAALGTGHFDLDRTPFALAMPDEYKNPDPVVAYRAYYKGAKANIATWKSPAEPPTWW